MSASEDLARNNDDYVASFDKGDLQSPPAKPVVVLTCFDARVDPARILGLQIGDAHVVRNAGGLASEDALRSIAISQHLLGTTEVMVIHHTNCGMTMFKDEEVADQIEESTGARPPMRLGAFPDPEEHVRATVETIRDTGFIKERGSVSGYVYQVEDGRLRSV